MRLRLLFSVFAVAAAATAGIIRVPSEQPTIQAGLGAAGAGDTVLVAPDTYAEHITWPSVDGITLLSEEGCDSTIIDGEYTGVCITVSQSSIKRGTVIQGFTITRGYGGSGAGMHIAGSPLIRGNRITRCRGTGIFLRGTAADFEPLVTGNEICGNTKETNRNYGGGIHVDCSNTAARPEICYNHIHHDTLRNGDWNYGGGVFCAANALVYQNVIEANVLTSDTSTACRAHGAGIYVTDDDLAPVIFCNLIMNNRCETDAWKYGAGIKLNTGVKGFVVNNTVVGNVCIPHMWSKGGGIYNDMRCTTYVKNNIITGNQATTGSGIFNYTTTQNGRIISLYNNYYNNSLSGCSMGTGDITGNPLFTSGWSRDYFLSQTAAGQPSNSPCVDAGDTLDMKVPLNLDSLVHAWTTRTDSVPDAGVIDMGYHYPAEPVTGLLQQRSGPHPVMSRARVFPNPFRTGATVRYSLPKAGPVRIRVFDAAGRELGTVLETNQAAGEHQIELKSGLGPGVYFISVDAAGRCTRLRCTVVE